MGKKGGAKRTVYRYRMSVDYAVCYGRIDSLNHILVRDRAIWAGDLTEPASIKIENQRGRFGGLEKEGGCDGQVDVYFGTFGQRMNDSLSARFGLTPEDAPGYRGVCHLFFRRADNGDFVSQVADYGGSSDGGYGSAWTTSYGDDVDPTGGFYWIANNPFLPDVEIGVTRCPDDLDPDLARVYPEGDKRVVYLNLPRGVDKGDWQDAHGPLPDANPALVIYECMTNEDWGMGAPASMFGDSWLEAAQKLYDEKFGISLIWNQQSDIQDFVEDVLDHIDGLLYLDPSSGLWELVLIRDDYDLNRTQRVDETMCRVFNRQRVAISETINEIVVKWTKSSNGETTSVTFQDIGNIAMQGGIVSETRDYPGIRNSVLAATVGAREIRKVAYPLFSCEVEIDEGLLDEPLTPGSVFRLSYADDGIVDIPLRVFRVDYGSRGKSTVRLTCTEDIFGVGEVSYEPVPETLWEDPAVPPTSLEHHAVLEPPYSLLVVSDTGGAAFDDADYPATINMVLANNTSQVLTEIQVFTPVTQANGDVVEELVAAVSPTGVRTSTADEWPLEAFTQIAGSRIRSISGLGDDPELGDFLMVAAPGSLGEIVMLQSYNAGTDTYTVARGMMDTVPTAHGAGASVWYLRNDLDTVLEPTERAAGSPGSVTLYPTTDAGRVSAANATAVNFTPNGRPYRPHRPANLRVDGTAFALVVYDATQGPLPATVTVSWANRNRLTEDTVAPTWTAANVTPEAGQTTTLRLVEIETNTVLYELTGLTGTSHAIPIGAFSESYRLHEVQLYAERGGLDSVTYARQRIEVKRGGYGLNYGGNYGSP